MAENERLDLGYCNSGRWRKWRGSFLAGKNANGLAEEGRRALIQTWKNLQKLFESANGVPMKIVLTAAIGDDGNLAEIIRDSKFGRDFLKLFDLQRGQRLDARSVMENVLFLTVGRMLDQIREEAVGSALFPDGQSFRQLALDVKDEMVEGVQQLAKQLAAEPDTPLKMPPRSADQKQRDQDELLNMSLLPDSGAEFHVTFD